MKVYEAVFKEDGMEGVYALSVVEDPAMQDTWITLSDHPKEVQLSAVDEEKRLLLGAALIPNKKIYRNIEGNEFYITFSEETIEKLAHNFFKQGNQRNSSLEHEIKLEGMAVVEGWIVQDPHNDKSNAFGKTYEKGTWVTMMKVDNEEIWQKAKSGEINGFSIDALLGLKELNINNQVSMTRQDFVDVFNMFFTKKDDIKEVEKKEVEQVELAEEPQEEPKVETQPEAVEEVSEEQTEKVDVLASIKELLAQMNTDFDKKLSDLKVELSKQVEDKDKEIAELKVELEKEPEAEPIKPNVVDKIVEQKVSKANSIKSRVQENLANFWE